MSPIADRDRVLIEGFLRGERASVAAVDAWILPVVRHRAWTLPDQHDDLAQEVRLRLLKALEDGGFREESGLGTFVGSIARHVCLDALRRARVRRAEPLEEEQLPPSRDQPDETFSRRESVRLCYRVLRSLPSGCRRMFRLLLEKGMTYDEIAGELGIGVGTVKSRLSRCRDRAVGLRSELVRSRGESG